jgi:cytochrome c biogenesis factor
MGQFRQSALKAAVRARILAILLSFLSFILFSMGLFEIRSGKISSKDSILYEITGHIHSKEDFLVLGLIFLVSSVLVLWMTVIVRFLKKIE